MNIYLTCDCVNILIMRINTGHNLVAKHCAQQLNEKGTISMRAAAEACGYNEDNSHMIAKARTFRKAFFDEIDVEFVVGMQKMMFNAARFKVLEFGVGYAQDELCALLKRHGMRIIAVQGDDIAGYKILYAEPIYEHVERALDTYYRLTGEYAPEKHQMVRPLEELSDEELRRMSSGFIDQQPEAKVTVVDNE